MKPLLFILLLISAPSCQYRHEQQEPEQTTEIISGNDTIVIAGHAIDVSKAHATTGHNDTVAHVFRIKFCNSFKKQETDTSDVETIKYYKHQSELLWQAINLMRSPRQENISKILSIDDELKTERQRHNDLVLKESFKIP